MLFVYVGKKSKVKLAETGLYNCLILLLEFTLHNKIKFSIKDFFIKCY